MDIDIIVLVSRIIIFLKAPESGVELLNEGRIMKYYANDSRYRERIMDKI